MTALLFDCPTLCLLYSLNWELLSARKLRKPGVPARLSLTVFASGQPIQPTPVAEGRVSAEKPIHAPPDQVDEPDAKRARIQEDSDPGYNPKEIVDLASQKHEPKFLSLPAEQQSWLFKLHRNLGHPSPSKLRVFCKQFQCPDELLKAIDDLKCSTCLESTQPLLFDSSTLRQLYSLKALLVDSSTL